MNVFGTKGYALIWEFTLPSALLKPEGKIGILARGNNRDVAERDCGEQYARNIVSRS